MVRVLPGSLHFWGSIEGFQTGDWHMLWKSRSGGVRLQQVDEGTQRTVMGLLLLPSHSEGLHP